MIVRALAFLLLAATSLSAQDFETPGYLDIRAGLAVGHSLVCGDFDGDGRLDIVGERMVLAGCEDITARQAEPGNLFATVTGLSAANVDGDAADEVILTQLDPPFFWLRVYHWPSLTPTSVMLPQGVHTYRVEDLDGDGLLDLVGATTTQVVRHAGIPGGSFSPTATQISPRVAVDIEVVDLDGDGVLDVLFPEQTLNRVTILFGSGPLTFESPVEIPTASGPTTVNVADLDQDGDLELIVGRRYAGRVEIFTAGPAGTFTFASSTLIGVPVGPIIPKDIDLDGAIDLAIVSPEGIDLRFGNGTGALVASRIVPQDSVSDFVCEDLDEDGDIDLGIVPNSGDARLIRGRGNREFDPSASDSIVQAGERDIEISDIDGDAIPEILVAGGSLVADIEIFAQGAGGQYESVESIILPGTGTNFASYDIELADFDEDGILDLVSSVTFTFTLGSVAVYPGLAGGTFGAPQLYPVGLQPELLVVADFDLDDHLDILVQNYRSPSLHLLLGDGAGSFATTEIPLAGDPRRLAVGDNETNGILDVIVQAAGLWELHRGNGDGTFTFVGPAPFAPLSNLYNLRLEDVNGDSIPDALLHNGNGISGWELRMGLGGGTYAPGPTIGEIEFPMDLADIDGDGHLDLVTHDGELALGDGGGDFTSLALRVSGEGPGRLRDIDGDAIPDLVRIIDGELVISRNVTAHDGDCNGDAELDNCQLAAGDLDDTDGDGNPDACSVGFRRGDVDGSGAIQVNDPIAILSALFSGGALACPAAADADDDGLLLINDPIIVLVFLFGFGPPPAPPWPDCGSDPGPSPSECAPGAGGCP